MVIFRVVACLRQSSSATMPFTVTLKVIMQFIYCFAFQFDICIQGNPCIRRVQPAPCAQMATDVMMGCAASDGHD